MRGILLGLLFSNMVFLAWNILTPSLAPVASPRVSPPHEYETLQLLAEIDAALLLPYPSGASLTQAEAVAVAVPEPVVAEQVVAEQEGVVAGGEGYCAEIGPFRSQEDAQGYISSHAERLSLQLDVRDVPAPPDYRVYLPPFSSRELAQSTLATLQAQFAANNVAIDTYLMPRGELANGIALGLFSEQQNALNVQRQMEVLGYKVVVRTEPKQRQEVWLVATGMRSQEEFAEHWAQMRLSRSYVDTREKLCETIAHAQ